MESKHARHCGCANTAAASWLRGAVWCVICGRHQLVVSSECNAALVGGAIKMNQRFDHLRGEQTAEECYPKECYPKENGELEKTKERDRGGAGWARFRARKQTMGWGANDGDGEQTMGLGSKRHICARPSTITQHAAQENAANSDYWV